MALLKAEKEQVVRKFRRAELDTGSPEVQVALLTVRINRLTDHFKQFKKDNNSRRGMLQLVSQRRRLLDFLKKNNPDRYSKLIEDLSLRK